MAVAYLAIRLDARHGARELIKQLEAALECVMGKVVVSTFISLDGFIEGPNRELVPPQFSADLVRYFIEPNLERNGFFIYGRVTYEMMVGYWTSPAADAKEAARLAAMRKYVYSRTLQKADWGRVTISPGDDLAGDVAAMRRETDRDMTILGSAQVVNAFLRAGLVDGFHLFINPILLGAGTPLFQGGYERSAFKLIEAHVLDTGGVVVDYARA
jgi:dihydrofolate reductase